MKKIPFCDTSSDAEDALSEVIHEFAMNGTSYEIIASAVATLCANMISVVIASANGKNPHAELDGFIGAFSADCHNMLDMVVAERNPN